MTIEQSYYDEAAEYAYFQKRYSVLAEWFIVILWIILCLEGLFYNYLQEVVRSRSVFWTRLTPFNLRPSELIFYGPVLFMSIVAVLRGRQIGYRTSRGMGLLLPLWLLGIFHAVHGKVTGATQNLWLADFRQLSAMSFFVPFFCILSSRIRLQKVADYFVKIGIVLALYNGTMGVLILVGVIGRRSLFSPYDFGEQLLILMYCLVLMKSILSGKTQYFNLMCLIYGIILPLHKTPMATFALVHFFIVAVIWILNRRLGLAAHFRAVKMLLFVGVFIAVMSTWFLTLGEGEAKRWLANRWLKVEVSGGDITSGRFEAWGWAIDQWTQHPLIGTGFGHQKSVWHDDELITIPVHNLALDVLYMTGITGFLLCLSIFVVWLKRMIYFFQTTVDEQQIVPMLGMFVWCLCALFAALFGRSIGINYVGFVFWAIVGILSNAETQNLVSLYWNENNENA